VALNVDVLVTWGSSGALAAKQATRTIPIVAADMGDPIGTGLANSLAHPGGNLTGLSLQWDEEVSGKWLELLQEAVPKLSTIAVIHNPDSALAQRLIAKLTTHALTRHLKLLPVAVRDAKALAPALKQAAARAQAVLLLPDPLIAENARRIIALMAENRLPVISGILEFAQACRQPRAAERQLEVLQPQLQQPLVGPRRPARLPFFLSRLTRHGGPVPSAGSGPATATPAILWRSKS